MVGLGDGPIGILGHIRGGMAGDPVFMQPRPTPGSIRAEDGPFPEHAFWISLPPKSAWIGKGVFLFSDSRPISYLQVANSQNRVL